MHPDFSQITPASGYNLITQNGSLPASIDVDGGAIVIPKGVKATINEDFEFRQATLQLGGELEIGTPDEPFEGRGEFIFTDTPIDLETDPESHGTGFLVMGKLSIHGKDVGPTWARSFSEIRKGDEKLLLISDASRWPIGGTVVIPDSRQVLPKDLKAWRSVRPWEREDHTETRTIVAVRNNEITLDRPLDYDHPGAYRANGDLALTAHVALISRNIVIRSENPQGTRAHFMAMGASEVSLDFVEFQDMGRTTIKPLSDDNVRGRYSLHFHRCYKPATVFGCSVHGGLRWDYVVHNSHGVEIENCVGFNGQGSGFTTEEGTEKGTIFTHNIAIKYRGTGLDGNVQSKAFRRGDYGRGGSGFWLRDSTADVFGCVAAACTYAGFTVTSYFNKHTEDIPVPAALGDDPAIKGVSRRTREVGVFMDCEAYRTPFGLWTAYPGHLRSEDYWIVDNFNAWHFDRAAVLGYHLRRVQFEDGMWLGDKNAFLDGADLRRSNARKLPPNGFDPLLNYDVSPCIFGGVTIENCLKGIITPRDVQARNPEPMLIEDCTLENYTNLVVTQDKSTSGSEIERHIIMRDGSDKVLDVPEYPRYLNKHYSIWMQNMQRRGKPFAETVVERIIGDDAKRIYFNESAANYVPPPKAPKFRGSPEEGLTNAQLWDKYGIAVGGEIAPCDDKLDTVYGIVCADDGTPVDPPIEPPVDPDPPIEPPIEPPVEPEESADTLAERARCITLIESERLVWIDRMDVQVALTNVREDIEA